MIVKITLRIWLKSGRAWVKIDPHELEILNCISPKYFRLLIGRYRTLCNAGGFKGGRQSPLKILKDAGNRSPTKAEGGAGACPALVKSFGANDTQGKVHERKKGHSVRKAKRNGLK